MKKILFLTHQIPYPAISGGLFKTAKLIEFLAEFNQVEVMVTDAKSSDNDEISFCKSTKIKKLKRYPVNRGRNPFNYLMSLIYRMPISVYRNSSRKLKKRIQHGHQDFNIIFIDHFLMFQYVPTDFQGLIVLHQHNAEYVLWKRYADILINPLLKGLVKLEANRIAHYEKKISDRSSVILCSPNDQDELKKLGIPTSKFIDTIHLGDTDLLEKAPLAFNQTKKKILFIGTLTWAANIDGLKWFLESVWPEIYPLDPEIELSIIGKCDNLNIFSAWLNHPQIKWHGFVNELDAFYNDSRLFIAPLRFGSGIKVKVVNAFYRGLPVVTTPVGAEGLAVSHGEQLMISTDEKHMVKNIIELLDNKVQWNKISNESRHFSRVNLAWENVLEPIRKVIGGDKWQSSQD